ncbi:unnamed protein product, partial [marine sediment metagenome]
MDDIGAFWNENRQGVTPFPTLYVEYEVEEGEAESPPVDPEYEEEHPEYVSPPAPTKNLTSNKHVDTP